MIAKIFPSYTLDSFKKMIKKIGFKRYESEDKTFFYSHHFFGKKGDVEFLTSQVFDPNYEQNQLQMTFERNFVETLRRKRSDDPSLKKLIPNDSHEFFDDAKKDPDSIFVHVMFPIPKLEKFKSDKFKENNDSHPNHIPF